MAPSLPMLDDRVAVCGQLKPNDMAEIAAAGFVAVVNNRPDGEALFGQPRTADVAAAAQAAGLAFLDLPFSGPRATADQVRAFADLLVERPGKVVVYCKSGMRSALLWGAAAVAGGRTIAEVVEAARRAGQNVEPVAEIMAALAQAAQR
ncbi:MAG: TIGR01244 family sulfur transferase [Reyranellaceae bacterium]